MNPARRNSCARQCSSTCRQGAGRHRRAGRPGAREELTGTFLTCRLPAARRITMRQGSSPGWWNQTLAIMASGQAYPRRPLNLPAQGILRRQEHGDGRRFIPLHYAPGPAQARRSVTGSISKYDYDAVAPGVRSSRQSVMPVRRRIRIPDRHQLRPRLRVPAACRLEDPEGHPCGRARHRDWIEANYPGRDPAESLRNYLKTCYPDSGCSGFCSAATWTSCPCVMPLP